jgi:hypothetical protein
MRTLPSGECFFIEVTSPDHRRQGEGSLQSGAEISMRSCEPVDADESSDKVVRGALRSHGEKAVRLACGRTRLEEPHRRIGRLGHSIDSVLW